MSYECETCGSHFESQKALNAHQIKHKKGLRYEKSRKKRSINYFYCLRCNNLKEKNKGNNLFCSQECSIQHSFDLKFIQVENNELFRPESRTLKRYLERKYNRCSACDIKPYWNGKELTLQLDHIDGNSDNHRLSNVRLLCPNCHSQTETYGNRGQGKRYKKTQRNQYLREYKNRT